MKEQPAGGADEPAAIAWWRRDAAERRDTWGELANEGEQGQGLDEGEFRRRFAHLFPGAGAA